MTKKQWFWSLLFILFVLLNAPLIEIIMIKFTVIFDLEVVNTI